MRCIDVYHSLFSNTLQFTLIAAQNPFGSPTPAPLAPQLTGVQFSTPSPETFAGNHHMSAISPQYTGLNAQQPGFGNTFNGEFLSKTSFLLPHR
jgi:hypothetical protein